MRFALLGVDLESWRLAEAAAAAGHQFAWCGDFSSAPVPGDPPTADLGEQWQDLFDSAVADAVIVGRGAVEADRRSLQMQELAKAGRPVLAVHPVVDSVLSYFEIDMARGESQSVLHYYNPLCHAPIAPQFAAAMATPLAELGRIEQIAALRELDDRRRPAVVWHFARDVQLLARIAGRFDRIGAHGTDDDDPSYAALAVQLAGEGRLPVRWRVGPVDRAPGLQVTLIGAHGRLEAQFDEQGRVQRLSRHADGEQTDLLVESHDPADVAFAEFAAAVESPQAAASNWEEALDAMELTDSIEISLRRSRMIDVHHQHLTEQMAFKGWMAAAGCGMLLVLPPLLLLLGWFSEVVGAPIPRKWWAFALGGLLAAFLALQVLPKLIYPTDDES